MDRKIASTAKSMPARAVLAMLLAWCLVFMPARAGIYLELGFDSGGDTLANTSLEDLRAGGGIKVAVGLQRYIGGFDDVGLIFSLGYLFDEIQADNGEAEIYALVAEFIYFREFGPHRLGIGASYHVNPRYKQDIDGFTPLDVDFDNALGLVGRYGYVVNKSVEFGFRYTLIDYEANATSLDANSAGFFISSSF